MKKILMGLVAISSLSFAIDLSQSVNNTNVFTPAETQNGKIMVQARLTSNPDKVKYVVFASETGNWDGTEAEVWKLPDFVVSLTARGFISIPLNKVYVKKVNGSSVENLTNENVTFDLLVDPAYVGTIEQILQPVAEGTSFGIEPFMLLSGAEVEGIVTKIGDSNYVAEVTDYGGIGYTPTRHVFRPTKSFKFAQDTKGVLTFLVNHSMTSDEAQPVLNALSTPVSFNKLAVQITVN